MMKIYFRLSPKMLVKIPAMKDVTINPNRKRAVCWFSFSILLSVSNGE